MWSHQKWLGRDLARYWKRPADSSGESARKTRVLLEEPDGAEAFAYWRVLTDGGYDVAWCPGPDGAERRRCPLVSSNHCGLLEHADVVLMSLGIDAEPSRNLLEVQRRLHPETPVIVQASRCQSTRWADLLKGNRVLRDPVTAPALLESVDDVSANRQTASPR